MSYVDAVTDVANRRSFEEELKMEWRRSTRAKSSLSLLMADIDGFKAYNDALGHQAGDDSLKKVRRRHQRQRRTCRRPGRALRRRRVCRAAARYRVAGGAAMLAERIRAAVEERNIWHPSAERGRLTISIGVATMTGREDADGSALVKAADERAVSGKTGRPEPGSSRRGGDPVQHPTANHRRQSSPRVQTFCVRL